MITKQKSTHSGLISSVKKIFSKSNAKNMSEELSGEHLYNMQASKGLSRKNYGPADTSRSRNRIAKSMNRFPATELD